MLSAETGALSDEPEGDRAAERSDSAREAMPPSAAAPGAAADDRSLRRRLRRTRERRRRQQPLEEDLTSIYIADQPDTSTQAREE